MPELYSTEFWDIRWLQSERFCNVTIKFDFNWIFLLIYDKIMQNAKFYRYKNLLMGYNDIVIILI